MANIRATYASAGLTFEQTAYVECHGTGTPAGDWRELSAISETVATCRNKKNPVIVGSIKPNVGHLEGAAGIAGLIKGVLALENGQIPPNANFELGNPDIDFENWKVKVSSPSLFILAPKSYQINNDSRFLGRRSNGPFQVFGGSASTASALVEQMRMSYWTRPPKTSNTQF